MSNISFDTKENKGLVWNIMNETGVFKGISDVYIDQVKRDFENKITLIKSNIQQKDTLTLLNKRVLSEMMTDMAKYRNISSSLGPASLALSPPPSSKSVPLLVTAKDVSTQRQQQFKDVFEKKKDEFINLLGNKAPSTIDFSDKLDKPIGSEIEDMLAATIARRNNDLNIVLDKQDTTTAAKWINSDNANANANNIIKIGQNTILDNNTIIDVSNPAAAVNTANVVKRVRFTESKPTTIITHDTTSESDNMYGLTTLDANDNDDDVSRFLSILNNKQSDNVSAIDNSIHNDNVYDNIKHMFEERLNRIEETQREILALLQVKVNTNNNANANANANDSVSE